MPGVNRCRSPALESAAHLLGTTTTAGVAHRTATIAPIDSFLTTEELAGYLSVPVATVYSWRKHDPGELRDALAAVAQLPPQESAVFVLREAFGCSAPEIADIIGTSPGAVKTALHRGRRRVAEANRHVGAELQIPVRTHGHLDR